MRCPDEFPPPRRLPSFPGLFERIRRWLAAPLSLYVGDGPWRMLRSDWLLTQAWCAPGPHFVDLMQQIALAAHWLHRTHDYPVRRAVLRARALYHRRLMRARKRGADLELGYELNRIEQ